MAVVDPYFDDGQFVIYHGRCEEILPTLAADSVDLVITSPPYNMGLVSGGGGRGMYRPGAVTKAARFDTAGYSEPGDDALPYDEYCRWQRVVLTECWRVVRSAIYYNHRTRVLNGRLQLPLDFDFGGLWPRQIITLDRLTGVDVHLRGYCSRQEWLLLFAKAEFRLIDHSASGAGDVWHIGMPTQREKAGHPAPFPLALPTKVLTTALAGSVLDPFLGSGTTLRAAKNLGLRGVGIEKNEVHCEAAAKRLAQEVLF